MPLPEKQYAKNTNIINLINNMISEVKGMNLYNSLFADVQKVNALTSKLVQNNSEGQNLINSINSFSELLKMAEEYDSSGNKNKELYYQEILNRIEDAKKLSRHLIDYREKNGYEISTRDEGRLLSSLAQVMDSFYDGLEASNYYPHEEESTTTFQTIKNDNDELNSNIDQLIDDLGKDHFAFFKDYDTLTNVVEITQEIAEKKYGPEEQKKEIEKRYSKALEDLKNPEKEPNNLKEKREEIETLEADKKNELNAIKNSLSAYNNDIESINKDIESIKKQLDEKENEIKNRGKLLDEKRKDCEKRTDAINQNLKNAQELSEKQQAELNEITEKIAILEEDKINPVPRPTEEEITKMREDTSFKNDYSLLIRKLNGATNNSSTLIDEAIKQRNNVQKIKDELEKSFATKKRFNEKLQDTKLKEKERTKLDNDYQKVVGNIVYYESIKDAILAYNDFKGKYYNEHKSSFDLIEAKGTKSPYNAVQEEYKKIEDSVAAINAKYEKYQNVQNIKDNAEKYTVEKVSQLGSENAQTKAEIEKLTKEQETAKLEMKSILNDQLQLNKDAMSPKNKEEIQKLRSQLKLKEIDLKNKEAAKPEDNSKAVEQAYDNKIRRAKEAYDDEFIRTASGKRDFISQEVKEEYEKASEEKINEAKTAKSNFDEIQGKINNVFDKTKELAQNKDNLFNERAQNFFEWQKGIFQNIYDRLTVMETFEKNGKEENHKNSPEFTDIFTGIRIVKSKIQGLVNDIDDKNKSFDERCTLIERNVISNDLNDLTEKFRTYLDKKNTFFHRFGRPMRELRLSFAKDSINACVTESIVINNNKTNFKTIKDKIFKIQREKIITAGKNETGMDFIKEQIKQRHPEINLEGPAKEINKGLENAPETKVKTGNIRLL